MREHRSGHTLEYPAVASGLFNDGAQVLYTTYNIAAYTLP